MATNTTISREGLRTAATQVAVLGAGGIHSAADALEKLAAGATLVQLYTGFIYEGPALVSRINRSLAKA